MEVVFAVTHQNQQHTIGPKMKYPFLMHVRKVFETYTMLKPDSCGFLFYARSITAHSFCCNLKPVRETAAGTYLLPEVGKALLHEVDVLLGVLRLERSSGDDRRATSVHLESSDGSNLSNNV
jgi:hypothetical protein